MIYQADQLEAKLREKELEMQTKDEEAAEVIKKIQQVDTDKETAQTQLAETNTKLEETDKRATEIRLPQNRLSDVIESGVHPVELLGPRLEPEGEDQATLESYSECRNLLYEGTDEPLFSDYGSESDDEDEYIKRRRCSKFIDDNSAMEEALSAVYLNSGTLIKMAIIGVELQNVIKVSLRKIYSEYFNLRMSSPVIGAVKSKMQGMKLQIDQLKQELSTKQAILRKEEENKTKAEAEVASLQKRIRQLEDELESTETRLQEATVKLEEASKAADESDRGRKVLENRTFADEERINQLEEQLKESTFMAEDADRKYDEAARKLAITEVELERAESRLEAAESRLKELQSIIHGTMGQLKSLEHQESQELQSIIHGTMGQLKSLEHQESQAEDRAQESERLVNTLQADADRLEETLEAEQLNHTNLRREMETMFTEVEN
ncbi:tropomyosin 1, partial [Schistosoma bovis]